MTNHDPADIEHDAHIDYLRSEIRHLLPYLASTVFLLVLGIVDLALGPSWIVTAVLSVANVVNTVVAVRAVRGMWRYLRLRNAGRKPT